ncbi:6159_t:CDS:2 [Entrophospora sp. SA101]|nr:6159_t:CDS:2 [Entrophospora sp. SA101]
MTLIQHGFLTAMKQSMQIQDIFSGRVFAWDIYSSPPDHAERMLINDYYMGAKIYKFYKIQNNKKI